MPQSISPDRAVMAASKGEYLGLGMGLSTLKVEGDTLVLDRGGPTRPPMAIRRDLYVGCDGADKPYGTVPELTLFKKTKLKRV